MQVLLSFRPASDDGLIEASVDSDTKNKLKNLNKTIGMYTYRQKRKNYFDSMVELSIESHVMPGKYNATDPVSNL